MGLLERREGEVIRVLGNTHHSGKIILGDYYSGFVEGFSMGQEGKEKVTLND